uniref:Arfaptin-1-like n=2 Tax=Gouania willdenowi TaxID=441366 RepID=A0A8C5GLC0_GOUWI
MEGEQIEAIKDEDTPEEPKCNHSSPEATAAPSEFPPEVNSGPVEQTGELPVTPLKPLSGPVIIPGNKNQASEKLERIRKWSIITYKCTKQTLSEKFGLGSHTVDLELEPRLEVLKENRLRYSHMTKLAQTLANQLAQFTVTQKSLGDAFTDLSLKSPTLHVEFGMNADAQKFLSKNGETLTMAINAFSSNMNTLVNKTIEDTMINVKQYETTRVAYDAYRVNLEELNLGPRDAVTLPKLEQAQIDFQSQKEKYQKIRDDLSVKMKLLEENKVKVLHNQLWLLHSAVAAHSSSCHHFMDQNTQQANKQLSNPTMVPPSWLEES